MSDPHRVLYEILQYGHIARGDGQFDVHAKTSILRALFNTIWSRSEWRQLFVVDEDDIDGNGSGNGNGNSSNSGHSLEAGNRSEMFLDSSDNLKSPFTGGLSTPTISSSSSSSFQNFGSISASTSSSTLNSFHHQGSPSLTYTNYGGAGGGLRDPQDRVPHLQRPEEFALPDERGRATSWKLSVYQKRAEERRRRAGKEPIRQVKKGRTCGKVIHRFDRTYTCKTCAKDSSCILCVECFQAGNHEGHEILFGQSYTFNAACDCGDTSAWREDEHLGCLHHPPADPSSYSTSTSTTPIRHPTDNPRIPDSLLQALYDTIVISLEFAMQVIQYSLLPSEYGKLPADENEMRNSEKMATGEPKDRRGRGPWAVTVYSDDKHVLKEVTRQIRDATGLTYEEAEDYAKDLEEKGRKVLLVTPSNILAFHTANMFQQIDLGVTLRLAYDVYREEAAGVVLSWIADMCRSCIAGDDEVFRRLLFRALSEPRISHAIDVGTPLPRDLEELLPEKAPAGLEPQRLDWMMRLDVRMWKMAKWDMRQIYSSIYILDFESRREFTIRFGVNYVRIFEYYLFQDRDLDSSLAFSLAYMILGNGPACAAASLNRHSLISIVIDTTQAFYVNQHPAGRINTHIDRTNVPRIDVDGDGLAFRGKKGMTLFGHLRALCRHKEIQQLIATNANLFGRIAVLLNLFVGIQTQRREQSAHVEYEVEWMKSFAILPDLARLAREFAESFQYATPPDILTALAVISNRILCDMMLMSKTLDPSRYAQPVEHDVPDVLIKGSRFTLLKLSVSRIDAFSFHHHLHYVFAEMSKWISKVCYPNGAKPEYPTLRQLLEQSVFQAAAPVDWERMKLMLIEWPLQTHVVLPQIRLGMWAKNGMAMRAQYHHYREVNLREYTVDQEFFMLQFGLCVIDQLKFITALIDRFGLANFFRLDVTSRDVWASSTEPHYRIALFEELLLLLIHLVTDTATINGKTQSEVTRENIIHQLALNSHTYSEIVKRLPERSIERGSLIPILNEVADFREPTDTAPGSYSLKPELYNEVDPYWHHYNRNEMREVVDKLVSRAKKTAADNGETGTGIDPVIKPRPVRVPDRPLPFSNIADWLSTTTATSLVHWTIAHCMIVAEPENWNGSLTSNDLPTGYKMPQYDALLDLGLHLAMMAFDADPEFFASQSIEIIDQSGSMSTFQNLWYMQTHEAFKSFRPKVDYLLDQIVANLPPEYTVDYRDQRDAQEQAKKAAPANSGSGDAKTLAQARQKALMAQFAKQQADFAAMMMDDEDDDDVAADEEIEATSSYGSCIVCQEVVHPGKTGGMLAYLQPSRIMREAVVDRDWYDEVLATPTSLDRDTRRLRYGMDTTGKPSATDAYPSGSMRFGMYVSACSHLMHESCMGAYNELTRSRQAQQVQRHQPENAMRQEYMCPLCKSLGNILIPLDVTSSTIRPMPKSKTDPSRPPTLSERIRTVSEEGLLRVSDSAKIWDYHVETGELVPWFTDCNFMTHALDPNHRRQHMRAIGRMIERVRNLARPLSEQSQRIRNKKTHMYLPDDMVGYTVSVCEVTQRGLPPTTSTTGGVSSSSNTLLKTVAEQVPETSMTLIKKLIGMLQLELDLFFGAKIDRTPLRVGIFARFLPDWYRSATLPSPLLLRQPLGIVVETAAIAPDLMHAVMIMAFYAELTRTMLGIAIYIRRCLSRGPSHIGSGQNQGLTARSVATNLVAAAGSSISGGGPGQAVWGAATDASTSLSSSSSLSASRPKDETLADALGVFRGFKPLMLSILRNAGPFTDTDGVLALVTDDILSKLLYTFTLPFLRRIAIIYYAVTSTYPVPTALDNIDASTLSTTCEYNRLLALLGIPRPVDTLSNPHATETPIVTRWLTQWAMQGRVLPVLEYPGTYELLRLPRRYEVAAIKYSQKRCDKCKIKPAFPALCLFCGKLVCLGSDCCSEGEQGECNLHMRECGAVAGMFVDIKRWTILYLFAGSGSFGPMPYLDSFGELDPSMRRGHLQFLHPGRMEDLRRNVWLQHSIPTLCGRKLELTSDGGGWTCL